ncbi:MAG: ImmA/IrrE family metallo-endopeptidase [Chloroflexota bacterium]|nr:ImmA/IrrE family metallo-endopeptidase [Dehalococcoidia bacterium]MDW8254553.1 ImmA/IrrE family metallo-endopeptidase [Chloroflexota bacterium]
MLNPAWIEGLAEAFWRAVGPGPRPRLEDAISLVTPLVVVRLPRLRPQSVNAWLARYGIAPQLDGRSGRLHGCLLVQRDTGVIFIDGSDPPEEQQFTLAHELAHYLADYQRPRERALRLLGPAIAPVLDGDRPPTDDERLSAVLRGVPLGAYVDLFEYDTLATMAHESDADRLAIELIAPADAALPLAAATADLPPLERPTVLTERLVAAFSLPPAVAASYAGRLLTCLHLDRRLPAWLAGAQTP